MDRNDDLCTPVNIFKTFIILGNAIDVYKSCILE